MSTTEQIASPAAVAPAPSFTSEFPPTVYVAPSMKFYDLGSMIETFADDTGVYYVARLVYDDSSESPEDRQDGFWPSLDPKSDGYIGPRTKSTLRRHMAKARRIMETWKNDEWYYVGVVLSKHQYQEGVEYYDDERDHAATIVEDNLESVWGIESNYPVTFGRTKNRNSYLTETARELLAEATGATGGAK